MQVSNKDELIEAMKNKKDDIEIKGDELVEEVRKILDK